MVKQGDIIWLDFLCDQSRTLDIYARNYEMIERLPKSLLSEVIDIISGFIEPE